jgi:hypothetical protein
VDASTVRLAGEVDNVFRTRVDSAFTGAGSSGRPYGIGLKKVKLVILEYELEEEDEEAAVDTSGAKASDR